jgi:hypothetical protein
MNGPETFTLSELYPGEDLETIRFRCRIGRQVNKSYQTLNKKKLPTRVTEHHQGEDMKVCCYPIEFDGFNFREYVRFKFPLPDELKKRK